MNHFSNSKRPPITFFHCNLYTCQRFFNFSYYYSSIWQITVTENLTLQKITAFLDRFTSKRINYLCCKRKENIVLRDAKSFLFNNCTSWKQILAFILKNNLKLLCLNFSWKPMFHQAVSRLNFVFRVVRPPNCSTTHFCLFKIKCRSIFSKDLRKWKKQVIKRCNGFSVTLP